MSRGTSAFPAAALSALPIEMLLGSDFAGDQSSAAVSELDRPTRVGTQSTEALVGAGSTAQEVVPAPAEEPVESSLAEETICAIASAKIVKASPAVDAVLPPTGGDPIIATACADNIRG